MAIDADFWARRRVLITGHTGFKGAWLSLWLQSLGAEVSGLAAGAPTKPSLYELARVGANMSEYSVDIRDAGAVREALARARPEVVLHMAAQPIVRRSLVEPAATYAVNVLGTVNLLEGVRQAPGDVRAVVVVTSDKCYAHQPEQPRRRFTEGDPLGGADPYSSSKACAELVAAAYRSSLFERDSGPRVASARAGNVIGGGDWGQDRLIADVARAIASGDPVRVRNPNAVRPWQHVLNPLSGYLLLAQELSRTAAVARAWNFGPRKQDEQTVSWLLERLSALWGEGLSWEAEEAESPPEAAHLALDSSASERELGWRSRWSLPQTLERIVDWHRAERAGADMRSFTLSQIEAFA